MRQFAEDIRGDIATFTLAEIGDRGAVWEVAYLDQVHRFTLDEWVGFGEAWCVWVVNKRAELRHKERLEIPA
ncbi:hypothetical protein [Mycolicibacterium gilvum]|uniref:hypothetical protein n=1 Tax=Mycolicibacterium gilvum TaxID=1804 RepID=UPI0040458603